MDESIIKSYLLNTPETFSKFRGVLSYEELPDVFRGSKGFYVVNSDKVSGKGLHWLVIYKQSEDKIEFFDSLGRPPEFYSPKIKMFLEHSANNYVYSNVRLQGESELCGDYCIVFVYLSACGYSLLDFINMFTNNITENDLIIKM